MRTVFGVPQIIYDVIRKCGDEGINQYGQLTLGLTIVPYFKYHDTITIGETPIMILSL